MRFICSVLISYVLMYSLVGNAQNFNIFPHEYNLVSILTQDPDCYPVYLTIAIEPCDTLTLDIQNTSSILNSINNNCLLVDDIKNQKKYLQLYGNKQYVLEDMWISNSEFYNEWNKYKNEKKYKLRDGGNGEISFVKVVGLFLKYRLNDDVDLIELYGERANTFEMICPLHIVHCEALDNINVIAK